MRALAALTGLLLLAACQSEDKNGNGQSSYSSRPNMPEASVAHNVGPSFDHPWLKRQPYVTHLDNVIHNDLEGIEQACHELAQRRRQAGFPEGEAREDLSVFLKEIDRIQEPLRELGLNFPKNWYSVLNLPSSSAVTPVPYQIHKRVYVDNTEMGLPVFLDLRVFNLDQEPFDSRVQDVVNWHVKLLEGSEESFREYDISDWKVLIGRGNHDTSHHDMTHGLASKNRGVFVAYLRKDQQLYLLFMDAPREVFDKHQTKLMALVP